MKIGNLNLDNRVFLSPMAGVTDLPFRPEAGGAITSLRPRGARRGKGVI